MMLKKFKILMLIIILSLIGIIGVISIWLYGSYNHRLEVTVSEVERSLFNSVQIYYESNEESIKQNQKVNYKGFDHSDFINVLMKDYRNIDSSRVQFILDSLWMTKYKEFEEPKENRSSKNKGIVPSYMLQQIEFNKKAVGDIDSILHTILVDKGILFSVEVRLEKIEGKHRAFRPKIHIDDSGMIRTRPVLVNPKDDEFLTAKFSQPVIYVLSKMFWQLVVGVLLVFGLVGTFVYLFWTINRQNKLALLRKSFVNNMTHELKTPVSTVMAAVEAVQRYGAKDDKVKMDKYLQISQKELTHLTNMIEKVLQLDVDEVSGITLEKSNIDIIPLITEAVELTKLGATKELAIHFKSSDSSILINADQSHLKNVLNNLLDNALKYSNDSVQIDINVRKKSAQIFVEIRDNGIGIDSDYLKNIFEMFFRVPNGNLHPVKGFGLGLAYVKQVVEQHGGSIAVNSELNKGTTFVIILPE